MSEQKKVTSTSIVYKLRDSESPLSVYFRDHSGVFQIENTEQNHAMIGKLKSSKANEQSVTFAYDRDLTILSIE